MPLIRRDAATVADLQAAKSRRKSIAGTGAVLRRMRGVACFRGTAGRFLPIKRAVRGSFGGAEWCICPAGC